MNGVVARPDSCVGRCSKSSCTACTLRFLRCVRLALRPFTTLHSDAMISTLLDTRAPDVSGENLVLAPPISRGLETRAPERRLALARCVGPDLSGSKSSCTACTLRFLCCIRLDLTDLPSSSRHPVVNARFSLFVCFVHKEL